MISVFIPLDNCIRKFVHEDFSVLSGLELFTDVTPLCGVLLLEANGCYSCSSVGQNISLLKPPLITQCDASGLSG